RTGGNAKRGEWEGVYYPMGAVYLGDPDPTIQKTLDDIGIEPVTVPRPVDAWYTKGGVVPDILHHPMDMPYSRDVRKSFRDAWQYFQDLGTSKDCPPIPVQPANARQLAYDDDSFLARYGRRWARPVIDLLDQYSRSVFGIGIDQVSSFGMITQFAGEFPPIRSLPGGNAAIAEKLTDRLQGKIRTGCFTYRVEKDGEMYRVSYLQDDKPHVVKARSVVVSAPQHLAAHMVADLPADRRDMMRHVRHGAYLVGLLFLHEPICDIAFDIWTPNRCFTDLVVSDWVASEGHPKPGRRTVMSAYMPQGELPGRANLLQPDYNEWREQLLSDVEKTFPGARKKVAGVQFVRYGHPMIIPYPGYIRHVIPKLQEPVGRVFFAHSDTGALPCIEGCIYEAVRTSTRVQNVLA
ncbi:MAG TPA: FAD-dependent oxidoreductase, partial [Candidatus Xenobia bacterium]